MKKTLFCTVLAATLALTACQHRQPSQSGERNRTTIEATFEQLDCTAYDHHLRDSLNYSTNDSAVTSSLIHMATGRGIESSYAENSQGVRVHWFRDLPYFVIEDSTGMRAYADFRGEALPEAVGTRGRDIVLKQPLPTYCSTQTGLVGDNWLALVTPLMRCDDWMASGGERCLDFYALADGRYLGSTVLPESPVETQWIQAVELQGDTLRILFTDRQSGSDCHYHVQFNLSDK